MFLPKLFRTSHNSIPLRSCAAPAHFVFTCVHQFWVRVRLARVSSGRYLASPSRGLTSIRTRCFGSPKRVSLMDRKEFHPATKNRNPPIYMDRSALYLCPFYRQPAKSSIDIAIVAPGGVNRPQPCEQGCMHVHR